MAKDDFGIAASFGPRVEKIEKVVRSEPPEEKEIVVTLDIPFEDVVKYDEERRTVRFACEPGQFLRLNDRQIDQLSALTRGTYLDAARTHKRALEEAENPSFVKGAIYQGATAHARLEVRNKEPGMHYVWKSPRNYRQAVVYGGYEVVKDEEIDTFSDPSSSVRTVGTHGDPEYILMKIPEAKFQERLKKSGSLSTERVLGAKAAGMADLAQSGAAVYDPDENPQADARRPWRDRAPE